MKIINFKAFNGVNIYSRRKCVRMDVDLEGYSDTPSNHIENFNETILELIPELKGHRCGIDEEGGFVKRLYEGTYLAHICEHVVLALHNRIGMDVKYGKAREIEGEIYYIIYEYEYKNTAIEIGKTAVDLINSIIYKKAFNLNLRMNEIDNIYSYEMLGPSTRAILNEANKNGIPIIKIGDGSLFQLGYGKNGRIIEATIGCNTSAVAVDIACDKLLTKEILYKQCIPVARGGKVRNSLDLLIEANSLGYPVVLKPRYGNQGKGVFPNLQNERQLLSAYEILRNKYDEIIIEKHIKGNDFRVCIVDGEVVAVSQRIPPYVIGNGVNNIKELIEIVNSDKDRGDGHEKPLTKIRIDEKLIEYIKQKDYALESIPDKGDMVLLRQNANLSTGGTAIDCTEDICFENINMCKNVAKTIGLDICGIDVCCNDISKPIDENGAIIEVNAAPGIRMHHYPYKGKSRNVANAIVKMITKECKKQIPIVSITGTNGKTTTTRLISHTLQLAGYNVGMTVTGGIYLNNQCIEKGDTTGYESAETILLNKEVEAAVLETARGGIIKKGLAYNFADVGVITNITEDHLGIDGINSIEELAFVKALIGEAVKKEGYVILNADDKMSMTIIERMKSNLILFSKDKNNEFLRCNIDKGGIGIYVDNNFICIEKEEIIYPIININEIKITFQGKLIYNIENAMAACGALIGLNLDYDIIRKGLSTFCSNEEHNPGRFNVYNLNDITVILDYGHNIEGYKSVLSSAKKFNHKRLVGIIGVPGDRSDSSVLELGKIAAENFNYVYIKEDEDRRGRRSGEIAEILRNGVKKGGLNEKQYKIVLNEQDAFVMALDEAKEGDLIIIFFENHKPLVDIINNRLQKHKDTEKINNA